MPSVRHIGKTKNEHDEPTPNSIRKVREHDFTGERKQNSLCCGVAASGRQRPPVPNRNLNLKARSLAQHRADCERIPQQTGDPPDNRQTETHALAARRLKLMELLEDVAEFGIGYAPSGVVHLDHENPIPTAAFDPYPAPLGVADRIADEVVQHVREHLRVGVDKVARVGNFENDLSRLRER